MVALEGSAYGIQSNVILPTAITRLGDEMNQGFLEIPLFKRMMETADWSTSEGRIVTGFNMPLALYLVSEHCAATHGIYSANSGRYARVGIAAAEGWVAPKGDTPPAVEDIAANFARIVKLGDYFEPQGVYEEFTAVAAAARRQGVYS